MTTRILKRKNTTKCLPWNSLADMKILVFFKQYTHTKIHHPSQSNTRMQIKTQSFSYVFHEIMCLHVCRHVFHAESLSLTHIYKYWPWNESNKTSWFLFLLLQFLCILYLTIKHDLNCIRQELTEEQKNTFILSDAAVTFKINEGHLNRYDIWHHAKFERCHYDSFQETKA